MILSPVGDLLPPSFVALFANFLKSPGETHAKASTERHAKRWAVRVFVQFNQFCEGLADEALRSRALTELNDPPEIKHFCSGISEGI